jgi:hypothetical protein
MSRNKVNPIHCCPICAFHTTEMRSVDAHVAATGHDMYSSLAIATGKNTPELVAI